MNSSSPLLRQTLTLLIITRIVVNIVWHAKADPDTCAIPILTAIGDIMGTVLLLGVFCLLNSLGDASALPHGEHGTVQTMVTELISSSTVVGSTAMTPTTAAETTSAMLADALSHSFIKYQSM